MHFASVQLVKTSEYLILKDSWRNCFVIYPIWYSVTIHYYCNKSTLQVIRQNAWQQNIPNVQLVCDVENVIFLNQTQFYLSKMLCLSFITYPISSSIPYW